MRKAVIATVLLALTGGAANAQSVPSASPEACAPRQEGDGARWLAPCEQAANAGDGHAALMVGLMYWNGDGVPKDNATAAHWYQMADRAGEPHAAKLLGDEAFVRVTRAARPQDADRTILEEALGWYEKALRSASQSTGGSPATP